MTGQSDKVMAEMKLETPFTKLLGCDFPIIAGPMFLVSDENLVTSVSNTGAVGAAPSLNWRTPELFSEALKTIRQKTQRPFGINLIVNKSNLRVEKDLEACVEANVPFYITSLGNPKKVIERAHSYGAKVFCDVTELKYAQKVQDMGADGVIAVSAGAGGHAGPTSPLVLIPYLREHLRIPIVAAGGIATGRQILAALILGADAVQIGTRFIASREAKVTDDYKKAIVNAHPEDIVMTKRISGTPAAVIRTPYTDRVGYDLSWIEGKLLKNEMTKKYMRMIRAGLGQLALKKAAEKPTWKTVWSAGQGVGLIDDILPAAEIMGRLMREYWEARENF